jgi:cell division protease FtsH
MLTETMPVDRRQSRPGPYPVGMSQLPPPPPPPPPSGRGPGGPLQSDRNRPQGQGTPGRKTGGLPRWSIWVLLGAVGLLLLLPTVLSSDSGKSITYSEFLTDVRQRQVQTAVYNNTNGHITGTMQDGTKYTTTGLNPLPDADVALIQDSGVQFEATTPESSWLGTLIPLCCR